MGWGVLENVHSQGDKGQDQGFQGTGGTLGRTDVSTKTHGLRVDFLGLGLGQSGMGGQSLEQQSQKAFQEAQARTEAETPNSEALEDPSLLCSGSANIHRPRRETIRGLCVCRSTLTSELCRPAVGSCSTTGVRQEPGSRG